MNGALVSADPDLIEPHVQGYSFFTWSKLATFLSDNQKTVFRTVTERNLKSFELYNNFELETSSINYGFQGNSMDVATNLKRDMQRITMGHNEFYNLPVSRLTEAWITGIRDPETGMAHYHGKIGDGSLSYKPSHHTGAIFNWSTDPSGSGIHRGSMNVNMFPLPVKMDHLNFSSGDHSVTEVSNQYTAVYHESSYITAIVSALNDIMPFNKQHASAWGSEIYTAMTKGEEASSAETSFAFDTDWSKFITGANSENGTTFEGINLTNEALISQLTSSATAASGDADGAAADLAGAST